MGEYNIDFVLHFTEKLWWLPLIFNFVKAMVHLLC